MRAELVQYLSFNGNCAEAMRFYQAALGGELSVLLIRDSPMAAQSNPEELERVMHARLQGEGWKIFASDIPAEHHVAPNPMVNLSVNTYTQQDAEDAFARLSEGGQVFMPLQKTFWAERFGMFADRFGFSWMVNYEVSGGHEV